MDNTCAIRVGRLLEVRVVRAYRTVADVDTMFDAIGAETSKVAPTLRIVTVADWRYCPVMSAEASEHARYRMAANNHRIERSAALGSRDAGVATLQFLRVIRESGHPSRRLFFDTAELVQWLSETLSPPEIARLEQFLGEGSAKTEEA